jgi:hypothetical protein
MAWHLSNGFSYNVCADWLHCFVLLQMAAQQQASALQAERTTELASQLAAQQKSTIDAVELARSLQVSC